MKKKTPLIQPQLDPHNVDPTATIADFYLRSEPTRAWSRERKIPSIARVRGENQARRCAEAALVDLAHLTVPFYDIWQKSLDMKILRVVSSSSPFSMADLRTNSQHQNIRTTIYSISKVWMITSRDVRQCPDGNGLMYKWKIHCFLPLLLSFSMLSPLTTKVRKEKNAKLSNNIKVHFSCMFCFQGQ